MSGFVNMTLIMGIIVLVVLCFDIATDSSTNYKTFDSNVLEVTYGDVNIVSPECIVKLDSGKYVVINSEGTSYLIENADVEVKVLTRENTNGKVD
jgi:hypothetical protein